MNKRKCEGRKGHFGNHKVIDQMGRKTAKIDTLELVE